jgi:hypothetical protein
MNTFAAAGKCHARFGSRVVLSGKIKATTFCGFEVVTHSYLFGKAPVRVNRVFGFLREFPGRDGSRIPICGRRGGWCRLSKVSGCTMVMTSCNSWQKGMPFLASPYARRSGVANAVNAGRAGRGKHGFPPARIEFLALGFVDSTGGPSQQLVPRRVARLATQIDWNKGGMAVARSDGKKIFNHTGLIKLGQILLPLHRLVGRDPRLCKAAPGW